MERVWLRNEGRLCLSGYPIQIVNDPVRPDMPYRLDQDGRTNLHYATLGSAKLDGERHADELDEFE